MPWIATSLLLTLAPKMVLTSQFLYNGVDRPFWVNVDSGGSLQIKLETVAERKVVDEKPAKRGKNDLAVLFSDFWKLKRRDVLLAQTYSNGKRAGAPLVLQPMTNPKVVTLDPETKNPKWTDDEDNTYSGIRSYPLQDMIIETEMGNMRFKLRPDVAPNTVYNFVEFIKGGLYRDVIFHRIVQKHPRTGEMFVIQGGDPTGSGAGSPGFAYPLEKSTLPHDFGVMGVARSTDPNTNGCQFYVALSRNATQHLDGRYVTFATVVSGSETIKKIANVEIGPKDDRPVKPPKIRNIVLVDPQ